MFGGITMRKLMLFVILITVVALVGCQQQTNNANPQPDNTLKVEDGVKTTTSGTSLREPSEMILEIDDFPEGWTLISRAERVKSDVSDEGLSKGWKKGYMATFGWQNKDNPLIWSRVDQYVSIYPREILPEMLKETSNENETYEELSNPNIGEASVFYKVTTQTEFGDETSYYEIIFYKKDALATLMLDGTVQDSELLKILAKEAASLIK